RMYEAFRAESDRIAGAYDLVYTVYASHIVDLPYEQLRELVADRLEKAGVFAGYPPRDAIVEPKEK
ncbi:MAG TPA: hypothetical protein VFM05_11380, partial [Candidatus Saccharimonadales bacterium]|nr:hypothetical protein [Candidatus Saccharimonadales bacterium]